MIFEHLDRIESTNNPRIKNISALIKKSRLRKDTGFFVAEGPRMVLETPPALLREVYVTREFCEDDRWRRFCEGVGEHAPQVFEVSDQVMRSVSDTVTPQGILAVISQPGYDLEKLLTGEAYLLVLERLQDPGNMGTIFRTAEGAGVTGIIMSEDCVDIFSPKVVRSTMGSLFRVPFYISRDLISDVGFLQNRGIKLFATHPDASRTYFEQDYTKACGFMIGNEGSGLSDELSDISDEKITIPMRGELESLNAAMAAGILLYEGDRQRRS